MDNNNTILLAKIRDVLSTLCGMFTSDLAIIKAKLEGISDLIIRNVITTDTDTIEFNTDLTEKLCSCKIAFEPIQAGTGVPSPDNVRTISGYDSISVAVLDSHDPDSYVVKEIEFDNTVYGGEVDVIGGIGESTQGFATFDGSEDEAWGYDSVSKIYYIAVSDMKSGNFQSGLANWLETVSVSQTYGIRFGANNTSIYLYKLEDNISDITDLATFKTYLSTHNLQICYPLATPAAISTTPEAITPIEGDNVISTNSLHTSEVINTTGIEVCYFETVNNYFKNKEV